MGEGENRMSPRLIRRCRSGVWSLLLSAVLAVGLSADLPQLGLQTWTCRNLSFEEMVDFASEQELTRIQLYRAHFDPADPANVNASKLKVMRSRGLDPYAMYAGMRGQAEENRPMFELARLLGLEFLVVEPPDQSQWPALLEMARNHGIKLAVHNHGIETTYGDPATVHALLKQYPDLRVCLDVGWVTAAGFDAAEVFRDYGDRVIDVHFKDKRIRLDASGKRLIEDTLPGEGDVNFAGLFRVIRETGWAGTMVIETDSKVFAEDPRELVQRSKAFFDARLNAAGMPVGFDYTRDAGALPELLPTGISAPDEVWIREAWDELTATLESLQADPAVRDDPTDPLADVEIYAGQVRRTLRYESTLSPALVRLVKSALESGQARAMALAEGRMPWRESGGRVLRGHRSAIDDSAQAYGIVVPDNYDGSKPVRLDVVLHGSIRSTWGSASLRFANWFQRYGMGWRDPAADYIEVYPLGRVTNGYRYAGQEDVFEAIEAVCREYAVDRNRIMLRGFSMGASGTWHIGLKQPDRFAALAPYMGYVDTRFFAEGGGNSRLIRVGELPPHQERVLPMMDAISYVPNAGLLPIVAAMGGEDPGRRNHEFMEREFADHGMQLINLIAPRVGHRIDLVTHRAQVELMNREAGAGRDPLRREVKFVTRSLRYGRAYWVQLLGLHEHDQPAAITATAVDADTVRISQLRNINRVAIAADRLPGPHPRVLMLGEEIPLDRARLDPNHGWVLSWSRQGWRQADTAADATSGRKRPGMQGPIDDAFTTPFLLVRGTGRPWSEATQALSDQLLQQFAYEWSRYWAGDVPIKDDREVTAEDIRDRNLILFGDPGSNRLMARVLPDLPLHWEPDVLRMNGTTYDAATHLPTLIHPNPLAGGEDRYVVLNSGHTFGESALSSVAYLNYARLGDWAVRSLDDNAPVAAGHFTESWDY